MAAFPVHCLAELNSQGVKYLLYFENATFIQSLQVLSGAEVSGLPEPAMTQIYVQVSLGKSDTQVAVNCESSVVVEYKPEKPMT